MIVPDSNLLLYAYNSSSVFHPQSRDWWENTLSGSEPVGLTHPVVFAFLRLSTNLRLAPDPFTLSEAVSVIRSWTQRSVCRMLYEGLDHVERVSELLMNAGSAGGNLVIDAQIAALAIAHRGTVHTADRDFERFTGLECHFPLSK